jgi:hypothetical protein
MKCTKVLLTILMLIFSFSIDLVSVEALSIDKRLSSADRKLINQNENRIIANGVLDSLGKIITNDYVIINGRANLIFPYFEDVNSAFNKAKVIFSEEIELVKNYFSLDEFNSSNYAEYKDAEIQYRNEFSLDFSYHYNLCKFESFISIYENSFKNDELQKLLKETNLSQVGAKAFSNNEVSLDILDLLPYYAVENEVFNVLVNQEKEEAGYYLSSASSVENNLIQPMTMLGQTQLQNAIYYATTYYQNYNPNYYHFNKDCTNFVSQILEYAGIAQVDYYPDEHSGWWHRVVYILFIKTHKHSRSWSVADVFARYMGVSNARSMTSDLDFRLFTGDISTGDFITADWENDGIWDHMGFVTQRDSYEGLYGTMTYYDFRVAQHSNDYLAWTSSSTNGWDIYAGRKYAIVRK